MSQSNIKNQFNNAASLYDAQRKIFIPFLNDYYESGIKYLSVNKFKCVLDLGAGTGLLTQQLRKYFPDAQYTLVDFSDKMLEIAIKRFKNAPNIKFVIKDYAVHFPKVKSDLIASALSIHHLNDSEKIRLYKNIFRSLNKNGYFINIDQYNSENDTVNDHYEKLWINSIKRSKLNDSDFKSWKSRRKMDNETTLEREMARLIKIGFKEVECIYKYWKFGVVVGKKEG